MNSDHPTLTAVSNTIAAGHVLHVRASRLPGRRSPRRDEMPAVDFTLGPDARGGFLLVDYSQIKSGEEQRHATSGEVLPPRRGAPDPRPDDGARSCSMKPLTSGAAPLFREREATTWLWYAAQALGALGFAHDAMETRWRAGDVNTASWSSEVLAARARKWRREALDFLRCRRTLTGEDRANLELGARARLFAAAVARVTGGT